MEFINPNSLKIIEAFVEPSLAEAKVGEQFQFQRLGYFNVDNDSKASNLVFNKTVGLKDSWAKVKPDSKITQHKATTTINKRKAIRCN